MHKVGWVHDLLALWSSPSTNDGWGFLLGFDFIGTVIIPAMPESSAWPDIRRWELHQNEDEFDEEDEDHHVVVHNELYISENEEDYHLQVAPDSSNNGEDITGHEDLALEEQRQVMEEELVLQDEEDDRQSHISGISQQDRDNKTILLRQAASGM